MPKYREITASQLSLEEPIKKQISDGNYISALFLIHSSIEYMLKQIFLSALGKKASEEIYALVNNLKLNNLAILLYLNETIDMDLFKELQRLHSLRHKYAHEYISKYLFERNEKEAEKIKAFLMTHNKVFNILLKLPVKS